MDRNSSRDFTQALLDALELHAAIVNRGGEILATNLAWEQFADENGGEQVGVGSNYLLVTAKAAADGDEVAGQCLAGLQAVFGGSSSYFSLEYPCHSPTEQRWFRLEVRPLAEQEAFFVSHTNITRRKLSEAAHLESDNRLRQLANTAPVMIWMGGLDKGCNYFNQSWLDFTGRTLAQEMGFGWAEGVHPDDFDRCLTIYTTAFDSHQPFSMEYRLRRADGVYRWILDNGAPMINAAAEFIGYIGSCIDISEQREAAQALTEREALLHSIVESVADGIIVINQEGIIESFNPAASTLFGYAAEEAIGQSIGLLMPPIHRERHPQYLANYLATGVRKVIDIGREVEGQRRDGSLFPAELTVSRMELGEQIKFTGVVRDISRRRRDEVARQQLLEAERENRLQAETLARVTLALASQTSLAAVLDEILTQAHQLVSYKMANILLVTGEKLTVAHQKGYTGHGLTQQEIHLYIAHLPLDKEVIRTQRPLVVGEMAEAPAWMRACLIMPISRHGRVWGVLHLNSDKANAFSEADAERLQPLANAAAVALQNARLYEEALHEIAAHEETATALRLSIQQIERAKREWEATVDALPQLICLLDKNHQIARINRAVEQWQLGPVNAVPGKSLHQLLHPTCTDRSCFLNRFYRQAWQQLGQGLPFNDAGYDPVLNRYLSLQCRPVFQPSSRIYATILIEDLSEQKAIEEAMLRGQKLESLGVMAGGVAHDFNNLLTGILAEASLASQKLAADHLVQVHLHRLIKTTERGAGLATQLLAYAGKRPLQTGCLDLNQMIVENIGLLQTIVAREVSLEMELAPELPVIEADAGQLQQVVMNLILNAAEACEGRPGHVYVRTLAQSVDPGQLSNRKPGVYVCFSVEDNGSGMTADVQQRIFDPFFTTKVTGRGLGLAGVQRIVRSHRGEIELESYPNIGTQFKVWLPAQGAHVGVQPIAEKPPADLAPTLPKTVLVIDDEYAIRVALADMLELYGVTVLAAENGREGVEQFIQQAERIDLIMLDMTLPVLSGRDTFFLLRTQKENVPIILFSGYGESEVTDQLGAMRRTFFLQKPFRIDQLLEQLHTAMIP
jgi:PAS domain S-box-containing protein